MSLQDIILKGNQSDIMILTIRLKERKYLIRLNWLPNHPMEITFRVHVIYSSKIRSCAPKLNQLHITRSRLKPPAI